MHVILNILIGIDISLFFGYSRLQYALKFYGQHFIETKIHIGSHGNRCLWILQNKYFFILQISDPSALKYTVKVHIFYYRQKKIQNNALI